MKHLSDKPSFTPRQRRLIDWLGLPGKEREPASLADMLRELGIQAATMRRWQARPGWQDAIYAAARAHLERKMPDILGALAERAINGEATAIKQVLMMTGRDMLASHDESGQVTIHLIHDPTLGILDVAEPSEEVMS